MDIVFDRHAHVKAGVSECSDGTMVWWNRMPVDEAVRENRERYFKSLGIDSDRVVAGGIAHGSHMAVVSDLDAGKYLLNTDALITNIPNLFLTITVADCMPIFCYDPVEKAVGIIHAGWRGLTGGVIENVIREFHYAFGSKPENLLIIIGPHIRSCHYTVRNEVADKFNEQNIERRDGHLFVKLASEAEMRLRQLGVKSISVSPICTYDEKERFYSARRDKVEPLQGMVAYIGIKE